MIVIHDITLLSDFALKVVLILGLDRKENESLCFLYKSKNVPTLLILCFGLVLSSESKKPLEAGYL